MFNARSGALPVKFTLTVNGSPTCQLPPATIALTRTAGGAIGLIDPSDYATAADDGSNFRVSDCQYVYSLAARSLGAGQYRADIRIDDITVGRAEFGLE